MYIECYQKWTAVPTSQPRSAPSERARLQRPPSIEPASEKPLRLQIQQARLRRRMTQAELAQSMSVPASVVADFEAGRAVPDGRVLKMLQDRLGGQLLGGSASAAFRPRSAHHHHLAGPEAQGSEF